MKKISIKTEYITLGQFLKYAGLIENGAQARQFLLNHHILVNDVPENRRGRKLYQTTTIKVDDMLFVIVDNDQDE